MLSYCRFKGSVIPVLVCLSAIGCGGNDPDTIRAANRPPLIIADSLRWEPDTEVILFDTNYTFSVRGIDPDISDHIVKYHWKFGGGDGEEGGGENIVLETSVPSVSQTIISPNINTLTVWATDNRGLTGLGQTFLLPLSNEEPDLAPNNQPSLTFATLDAISPLSNADSSDASRLFVLSFEVFDADGDPIVWKANWDDGTEEKVGITSTSSDNKALVLLEHHYTGAGAVTVTITADDGRSERIKASLTASL
jgi:hypothetical protein